MMMAEMTRNLAAYMVAQGTGTALNQDVFLERQPPLPAKCICLTDTGGYPPSGGIPDLKRTMQVMVRDQGVKAAKQTAWTIYGLFSPVGGRHIKATDGTVYLTLAVAPPSPLGEDDDGRQLYALNLIVTTLPE